MDFDICNLQEIITEVEGMLKGQIVSSGAIIFTDLRTENIRFPKIHLKSIFYNLISNSIKYKKPDVPPFIEISSNQHLGKTVLIFKDNGLGIDLKKHGDNVFKLNKVFHRGFDSRGVGLFMTKTQIETFGGSISVESEHELGTIFIITL